MERKIAVILGLIMIVCVFGTLNIVQFQEQQKTNAELEETKLYYSYASDMLGGFLHDRQGTEKQVQSIRENPNQTI